MIPIGSNSPELESFVSGAENQAFWFLLLPILIGGVIIFLLGWFLAKRRAAKRHAAMRHTQSSHLIEQNSVGS